MLCILCDDHPIVLLSQSMMLEGYGHEVAATASRPDQLPELVHRYGPDVCLTDLLFGDEDQGDDALAAIREVSPTTDVIVISGSATSEQRRAATAAGAAAVISKGATSEAILALVEGRVGQVEPPAAPGLSGPAGHGDHFLTPREREVLQCLADGESTERIAIGLGMRHATARSHVQSVLLKLGVHTRTAAVAIGVRSSLVVTPGPVHGESVIRGRLAHPSSGYWTDRNRRGDGTAGRR